MAIRMKLLAGAMLGLVAARADAQPSSEASEMIAWVVRSGDSQGRPFMIIDKLSAEVLVYDREGVFMGATPALIGSARGDHEVLGVGDRELSDIKPSERTTPAGRFIARMGPSLGLGRVLWIDIPGAVALHPVITNHPREHRVERLRSLTPDDNRITYGCINISPTFYQNAVMPLFEGKGGVVYILPEERQLSATFPGYRSL
jgi:hypothetical protein